MEAYKKQYSNPCMLHGSLSKDHSTNGSAVHYDVSSEYGVGRQSVWKILIANFMERNGERRRGFPGQDDSDNSSDIYKHPATSQPQLHTPMSG